MSDHRPMLATLGTLIEYEAFIVLNARREIRRWARVAGAMPDRALRGHATDALLLDGRNAEAAAAFAVLAPRHQRRATVELLVAQQVLLDYVDILGERIGAQELRHGLAIGRALIAAVAKPEAPLDFDPLGDDGGYLAGLVMACRRGLWRFPSAGLMEQQLAIAAARCGAALAYTHSAAHRRTITDLRDWAVAQDVTPDYSWWETAAGSNSNLAVLALLAAAADPLTTCNEAATIASAYWPHVCVMSTLLDSLVDYERDASSVNFSFVSHYPNALAARDGLIHATRSSLAAVEPLRHSRVHTTIVGGVAAYYAASAVPGSLAATVAPSVVAQLGRAAAPIVLALRVRHRRSC